MFKKNAKEERKCRRIGGIKIGSTHPGGLVQRKMSSIPNNDLTKQRTHARFLTEGSTSATQSASVAQTRKRIQRSPKGLRMGQILLRASNNAARAAGPASL